MFHRVVKWQELASYDWDTAEPLGGASGRLTGFCLRLPVHSWMLISVLSRSAPMSDPVARHILVQNWFEELKRLVPN